MGFAVGYREDGRCAEARDHVGGFGGVEGNHVGAEGVWDAGEMLCDAFDLSDALRDRRDFGYVRLASRPQFEFGPHRVGKIFEEALNEKFLVTARKPRPEKRGSPDESSNILLAE